MCGIAGILFKQQAGPIGDILIKMLADLNRRGPDSTGVALYGNHGISHTRLAPESRVDISHSHPFWARPFPDIAVVHNGHITNYHKLRRHFEMKGHRFNTENDSEVIAIYIADIMEQGGTLQYAVRSTITALDGTFTYLVATADSIGYARDKFGTKPLVVTATGEFGAVASA